MGCDDPIVVDIVTFVGISKYLETEVIGTRVDHEFETCLSEKAVLADPDAPSYYATAKNSTSIVKGNIQ